MAQPQRQAPDARPVSGTAAGSAAGQAAGSFAGKRRPGPGAHGQPRKPAQRPALRPWGTFPGRSGVVLVIGGALVGGALTVLTGSAPGTLLGVFLVAATVAAALAVRPEAARLIVPVPALAYLVVGVIAGLIHDRAAGTSHTALLISAGQSIASGFLAMVVATALAIAIAAARWLRMPRGQSPKRPSPATRASSGRNPASHRPADPGSRPPRGR